MRVLLTGGTGFLGKLVLEQLIARDAVSRVLAISRTRTSHPSAKVRVIRADLSSPAFVNELDEPVDVCIHLAGLYDFHSDFASNYEANVLGTLHLLEALKKHGPTRIIFASTYAVGIGSSELTEEKLAKLPSRGHFYSHTKALAEALLESSPHCCDIYRFGILIGDSRDGAIEKSDGPYSFYRLMRKMSRAMNTFHQAPLPIPAEPDATLPFVAVDEAAAVLIGALFKPPESEQIRYFGAYRTDTLRVHEWVQSCVEHLSSQGCRLRPVYSSRPPSALLKVASRMTGVPTESIHFACWKSRLRNEKFLQHHGESALSPWLRLRDAFFSGGDSA